MIYYICDDVDMPGGGRRVIYEHVELLNRNGVSACVLHGEFPFKPTWHSIKAPMDWLNKVVFEDGDLLAVPEVLAERVSEWPVPRKVIFAQGAYMAHNWTANPYRQVEAAMVVSIDSAQEMMSAYPWLKVRRVFNAVRTEEIEYRAQKEKIVLYNPRKGMELFAQAARHLMSRGVLAGWQIVPCQGTPGEVSGLMERAAIYMAHSLYEGFGLMPLEAGAAGCGVVGYSGGGGDEYWDELGYLRVERGAVRELVGAIEWAAQHGLRTGPQARQWIETNYNRQRQERTVLAFWREMMGTPAQQRPVSVIIPSMGRAAQLRGVVDQLGKTAPGAEIVVVVDEDISSVDALVGSAARVVFRPIRQGALSGWNDGLRASQMLDDNGLFVLGADDLIFHPGWYEELLRMAEYGEYIGLTYYNRGHEHWPTHYAVQRGFCADHLNGSIGMEAYHHNCTDLESWARATRAGGYVEGQAYIEHRHPAFGTAPIDDTYRQGALYREKEDLAHYHERRRQGFPDSWERAIGRINGKHHSA